MNKKIYIIPIIMSLLMTGCSSKSETDIKPADNTFVMYKYNEKSDGKYTSDVYVKYEGKDIEKIESNMDTYAYGKYLEGDKSLVMLDEDDNLNKYNSNGEKEVIAKDVVNTGDIDINPYIISADNKSVIYLDNDKDYNYDLYMKNGEKDKVKIDSEVYNYETDYEGKYVYYVDNEDDLRIYKTQEDEKEKIDSDIDGYVLKISKNGENIVYTSEENLYIKNINKDDKEKITSDDYTLDNLKVNDDGSVVFMDDYDSEDGSGELTFYSEGKKNKIASDVTKFIKKEDTYFYINEDDDLYEKSTKDDKSTKVASDVKQILETEKGIVYLNNNGNIYSRVYKKESEKIGNDLENEEMIRVIGGKDIAYINSDNKLFVNDENIASDVVNIASNSKTVAYVNKKNEVHSYDISNKSDKVEIKDGKEYSYITFENQILFSNKLEPYELSGFWKVSSDVYNYVTEFRGNNKMLYYYDSGEKYNYTYKVEYSGENYMNIKTDNDVQCTITKNSDNKITFSYDSEEIIATKIPKSEADRFIKGKPDISDSDDYDFEINESSATSDVQSEIESLMSVYEYSYVEAVNCGDFSYVVDYLTPGGKLYADQSNNIPAFYDKGIREYLYDSQVKNIKKIGDDKYEVSMYEKIGITKPDEDENIKEFNSTYIVSKQNGEFLIDEMK